MQGEAAVPSRPTQLSGPPRPSGPPSRRCHSGRRCRRAGQSCCFLVTEDWYFCSPSLRSPGGARGWVPRCGRDRVREHGEQIARRVALRPIPWRGGRRGDGLSARTGDCRDNRLYHAGARNPPYVALKRCCSAASSGIWPLHAGSPTTSGVGRASIMGLATALPPRRLPRGCVGRRSAGAAACRGKCPGGEWVVVRTRRIAPPHGTGMTPRGSLAEGRAAIIDHFEPYRERWRHSHSGAVVAHAARPRRARRCRAIRPLRPRSETSSSSSPARRSRQRQFD